MAHLTKHQLAIQHLLGNGEEHAAWHSTNGTKDCKYCTQLNDIELYIQARIERSKHEPKE